MIGSAWQVLACHAAHWGCWGEGGGDRFVPSSLSWAEVGAVNIDAESCCSFVSWQ